jgi:alkyl hydroperoxide reductase subunit F
LDGIDLVKRFREHLQDYKTAFEMKEGESVLSVDRQDEGFLLKTEKGTYETKTILVATGARHRTLGVDGEKDFVNKGISYCATCDAPLFKSKKVFVIGGGNSAMDAALFAAKYASSVSLVALKPELQGDDILKKKVISHPSIAFYPSTKTVGFFGDVMLKEIEVEDKSGKHHRFPADGVFIEIGLEPAADFISFIGKDHWGQIVVDKFNATNVEGIFAAGDVTDVTEKQIAVAVGEGAKAALSVIKFLQRRI